MAQPVCLAWLQNQLGGHYKRSVGSAFQIGFGNIGGIVASNIFIAKQAPRYPVGFGVAMAFLGVTMISASAMYAGLKWENRKRDAGKRDHRLQEDDVDNMGDDHPSFRFSY